MYNVGFKANYAEEKKIRKLSLQYWNYKGFYRFPKYEENEGNN